MEARLCRIVFLAALLSSFGAGYRSTNFIVNAPTPELAEKIGRAAERYRHDLAIDWLGSALADWRQPCPIHVQAAPNLGAGGATSFMFDQGDVYGWQMNIQGSEERLLDSVLPHEVTHTIFASHFRRPLPRWADEGACTTVEHTSERAKQEHLLIDFLRTGRGIAFSQMFAMTEYPQDILPLYAQGYSLARFLIDQKGRREFIAYVQDGVNSGNWSDTGEQHYGYRDLAVLQNSWLDWVKRGSPLKNPSTTVAGGDALPTTPVRRRGSNVVVRAQAADRTARDDQQLVPVRPVSADAQRGASVISADERRSPSNSRRANDVRPIRNGSVAIDYGEPVESGAAPPLPAAAPVRGPDSRLVASAAAGQSVYGSGVGMIHRGDESASQSDPPAGYAADANVDRSMDSRSSAFVAHRVAGAAEQPHKLLEWTRE